MVFDEIGEGDIVPWAERIGASPGCLEALELLEVVICNDYEINKWTMINVLSALANESMLKLGKQIQSLCCKLGFLEVVSV